MATNCIYIQSLKELAAEYLMKKYPTVPQYAIRIHPYSDKTSGGLTKCILDFLKFSGWQGERISPEGRVIDSRKNVVNCVGQSRQIGSIKRIKSSMTPGTADVSAIINGRAVKLEIKIGADKQSPEQKAYQKKVEKAGGVYLVVKDFRSFLECYKLIIKN